MGPLRRLRYRRARRQADFARQAFEACPCEAHRYVLVGALVDEGRIRYAKLLKKLRDL